MHRQTRLPDPEEHQETREFVKSAFSLARSLGIKTLVIAQPARYYPWLQRHKSEVAATRHLARFLEIALHFAREGGEGSSIGAIFVLGNASTLFPHLRQLILNPLKGHTPRRRAASTILIFLRRCAN